VARQLPSGTVTFLFTDVEGSTKLLHELGEAKYAEAMAEHRRLLRAAFAAHGGTEVDTQGDAFFVAFPTAAGAIAAAEDARASLEPGPIRVRIGLHTGTPHVTSEGYVGFDVHRAARIAAIGHGGQVLLSASTAVLVDTELRDLGEHRLKDLSAPERIYQLGASDFAPLTSLYRTNLPVPATPFLGREHEVTEVVDLLSRSDVRFLTLTGPGGTGKTRLALQAAADCASDYPGGTYWVPLAPLRDAQLVLEAAGRALGAKASLAEHIGDKSLLLFIDNFEHLLDAAEPVAELLGACPHLKVLITSREVLRLPAEHVYLVPALEPEDGRRLFAARARAVNSSFVPTDEVRTLCERLDNLPLALELAAARMRVLAPAQLLERLSQRLDLLAAGRGVEARQQTLRATIEWSYDLLDPKEKRIFARLAVFAGGCTLEAAEHVCEADVDDMQALVDKSLVRVRPNHRFWMLETIREFAADRLGHESNVDEPRHRHAEYFFSVAAEAEPQLRGNPREWLDHLEADHDNLRAALDHFESIGETQRALLFAGCLYRFWMWRGYADEGLRRLDALLASDTRETVARVKGLVAAANLTPVESRQVVLAEEAVALAETLQDERAGASARVVLAMILISQRKDLQRGRRLAEEAMESYRALGDDHYALTSRRFALRASYLLGDTDGAKRMEEDCLRLARRQGNETIVAASLRSLARFAYDDERFDDAVAMLQEAVPIAHRQGNHVEMARSLYLLSAALTMRGEAQRGLRLLSFAQLFAAEVAAHFESAELEREEATLALAAESLDAAAYTEARTAGTAMTLSAAVALALQPPARATSRTP